MIAVLGKLYRDPRLAILLVLGIYLTLGITLLGFNRTPAQVLVTSATACFLEVVLARVFRRSWEWPLSALITSFGLSILLNYSHDYFLLVVPVFFAIGSKYLFTFEGRHAFNPAMAGVAFSLLFAEELISIAPAYQWYGVGHLVFFAFLPGILLIVPGIRRGALVLAFLLMYTFLTALRAWIMRYHLPFETLFWGTLSSPPFLLFTFFMITDPRTSPDSRREQIEVGVALALVDLLFHLFQSYFTFFYAALTVASARLLWRHAKAAWETHDPLGYLRDRFFGSGYFARPALLGLLALLGVGAYRGLIAPLAVAGDTGWKLVKMDPALTGIHPRFGNIYERLDPRIQHVAKWLLAMGDSVAAGDFEGTGRPGLFLGNPLQEDSERGALYRNLGAYRFERVPVPALAERAAHPEKYGLPTQGIFVDVHNSGRLDLFVNYAFGSPLLLENRARPGGGVEFVDVTREAGLQHYTNSLAATFADVNGDGLLDLVITNVLPTRLPDYPEPRPLLNLFRLPDPEFPGDRRMFHFMHESWNNAANGGEIELWLQDRPGHFTRADSKAWGLTDTRWTMAVGAADLNRDGRPDLYFANDFGPDNLLLNEDGKHFRSVKGKHFGSVGRDTYKGMNVSIGDLERDGWQDIYISDVHHALQAEGSLLWMFSPSRGGDPFVPEIRDEATELGALNESRFGWGGVMADFGNDGWLDIGQANGMVDDSIDKRFAKCPDYWYVNEKVARSPPSVHSYADTWGDIRGSCIYGHELDRIYLNRGRGVRPQFVDVGGMVGLGEAGMSRAMAAVDLDGRGRLDLVLTHQFRPPTVYRNESSAAGTPRSFLRFELAAPPVNGSAPCNRQALGSRVTLVYAAADGTEVRQMRELQAVSGMSAQSEIHPHFGLGPASSFRADTLRAEVTWCGHEAEIFSGLAPNKTYRLTRGSGRAEEQNRGRKRQVERDVH